MASKKKVYAQGEMRPLSALAKQTGSSPKKRNAPTRVPEPPKLPQYSKPQPQESVRNTAFPVQGDNDMQMEEAQKLFKSVSELEEMKNESAPISETAAVSKPKPEPKPEPKPQPRQGVKRVPVQKQDNTIAAFTKPGLKPLTEYRQEEFRPSPARKRGSEAPDLSKKAERDAFFSKYTTVTAKKPRDTFPAITEEYIRMQEPVQKPREDGKSAKRVNPFLAGRTGGNVISHAKEDSPQQSAGAAPADNPEKSSLDEIQAMLKKHSSDNSAAKIMPEQKRSFDSGSRKEPSNSGRDAVQHISGETIASPEMRENIEGAIKLQRKEREDAAKARQESEDFAAVQKKSSIFRTVGIMGAVVLFGVFLLVGDRSDLSSDENSQLAEMPSFSLNSYLNGEFTSGIVSNYNYNVPVRSKIEEIISSLSGWKGLPENSGEESEPAVNNEAKEEKQQNDDIPEMPAEITGEPATSESAQPTDVSQTTDVSEMSEETVTTVSTEVSE